MIIQQSLKISYRRMLSNLFQVVKVPIKCFQKLLVKQRSPTNGSEKNFSTRLIDLILEPLYWFVDNYTAKLGPFFVIVVLTLLIFFIILAYLIGLPYWLERNVYVAIIALILGNYILVNVAFHYYMALTTPPGNPPMDQSLMDVISRCKKCGSPKPPRTHHCSVCKKCILKMDHHCPWLNNCIGLNNHRFFFMFCLYTWVGTIFIIIFGVIIAYEHFVLGLLIVKDPYESDRLEFDKDVAFYLYIYGGIQSYIYRWQNWLIQCELLLCVGAFLSVGALGYWHIKLITRAETCVESFIEMKLRQEKHGHRKPSHNPFDKGPKQNWINFLGLNRPGISWINIFIPSTHSPRGTGLHWDAEK